LYALALEGGDILPRSLLHDVPTQLGQYRPENYYETYDGAVQARRALIRSLNVPFVLLLQKYGLEKFHYNLQRLGLGTINKPPDHYGLSLILGGAEANLLDITNTYACMGRTLGAFYDRNGKYAPNDFRGVQFLKQSKPAAPKLASSNDLLSAGAIWHTFEAMREVERPNSTGDWELFRASQAIAWKTGTSFGFRDAWAAGVTPRYAVGVWVGNADGEGRPGLIGVEFAAPVLFEIFEQLPQDGRWFDPPYDDMTPASVCPQSGFRAGEYCVPDTMWIPESGLKSAVCQHHQLLHLDASGQWQVNGDCASPATMQHVPWFVLPPIEEYYFKSKNPWYPKCATANAHAAHLSQTSYPDLRARRFEWSIEQYHFSGGAPQPRDGNLLAPRWRLSGQYQNLSPDGVATTHRGTPFGAGGQRRIPAGTDF
jgi:penicillin-binding protein 1C